MAAKAIVDGAANVRLPPVRFAVAPIDAAATNNGAVIKSNAPALPAQSAKNQRR